MSGIPSAYLLSSVATRLRAIAWPLLAIVIVVLFWVLYSTAMYRWGVTTERTRGDLKLVQLQADHDAVLSAQRIESLKRLNQAVTIAEQLRDHVERLATDRQAKADVITRRIPHVTTVYVPAPGAVAVPLPACLFTRGYLGLWNAALARDPAGFDHLLGAAGVDAESRTSADTSDAGSDGESGSGAATEPGAELAIAAGVTPAALLENHTLNAERCAGIEDSRTALIQWIRAVRADTPDR